MIDQYKNETSQIHAPADLILKTKQAVREEEMRLEREKAQQGQNVHKQTVEIGRASCRERVSFAV